MKRRPPARREPGHGRRRLRGPIPGAASHAFRRARRRRFIARRVVCILLVCFAVVPLWPGTRVHLGALPERGDIRAVLAVEATPPLAIPSEPPPDMSDVWAAAVAQERWPGLATDGRTRTSSGKVALTFDDGPDPLTTPLILDTLRERGVRATFFVVGRRVEENPGLLRRIVAEGHAVGNHTYDHADMSGLSAAQMRAELRGTQEAVDGALGYHHPMALMRPPYGNPFLDGSEALPTFREVVRGEGLFAVTWTVDPGDYLFDGQPEDVVRGVAETGGTGGKGEGDEVVLLHDNQAQTAEALPAIIDHYDKSDQSFAGVDELLADKYAGP